MKKIEIALASENNYFCGLLVTGASIAHFAAPDAELNFTILDNGISDINFSFFEDSITSQHKKSTIHRLKMSENDMSSFPDWHGNKATYARLKLPELLSEDITHVMSISYGWLTLRNYGK